MQNLRAIQHAPLQTCLQLDEQQQRYSQQQLREPDRQKGRIKRGQGPNELSSIERVSKGSNELELSSAEKGAYSRLAKRQPDCFPEHTV